MQCGQNSCCNALKIAPDVIFSLTVNSANVQELLLPAIYGVLFQANLKNKKENIKQLYWSPVAPNKAVKMSWSVSLMLLLHKGG